MRKVVIAALAVMLLVVAVDAQTIIKMPAYTSTFGSNARGFYFQAPTAFTIVGLKVYNEKAHAKQNVAVFKMKVAPPAFSATSTAGLVYSAALQPSSLWINCHIPFNAGDFVGVLGTCGDASVSNTSYGPAVFPTTVAGASTTLYRLLTQFNLTSLIVNKVPIAYSTETGGSVGRTRVVVIPSPDLQATGTGAIGTTISYTLSSPVDRGLNYQVGTSLGHGPIAIDTRSLWLGFDSVLVLSVSGLAPSLFVGYSGALNASGTAAAAINVPNIPALKGIRLVTAYVTIRAAAPSGVNSISAFHDTTIP